MTAWRWRRHPAFGCQDDRTVGQRAADVLRNGMGSWPFIFAFLAGMGIWAFLNSVLGLGHTLAAGGGFDPYPYILLNLVLSTLAGLQGAILLIAAKRQDAIAAVIALHTEKNTDDLKDGLEANTALTRAVHENTQLVHLLTHRAGVTDEEIRDFLATRPAPGVPEAGP